MIQQKRKEKVRKLSEPQEPKQMTITDIIAAAQPVPKQSGRLSNVPVNYQLSKQISVKGNGSAADEMNRWKDKANQGSKHVPPAKTILASVDFAGLFFCK